MSGSTVNGFRSARRERKAAGGDEGRMPLLEHLRELRSRLVKSALALIPGAVVGWIFYDDIVRFLTDPVCQLPDSLGSVVGGNCGPLVVSGLLTPFNLQIKISLATGVLLASPVWLYQLWAFITPGLHRNERRWSMVFLGTAVPLFFAGAALCYLILPTAVRILLGFVPMELGSIVPFDEYLAIVTRLILAFGLAFEIPVFVVLLNFVGVLPAARLRSWWRQIIFAVFLFAAVITPTGDPGTMSAIAVPVLLLIVIAYLICYLHDRRRRGSQDPLDYDAVGDDELSPLDESPSTLDD